MRVIFDLDGTLIDSAPDIHAASVAVMRTEGMAPLDPARVRGFIGNGVGVLVSRCIAAAGVEETPELHARMTAQFVEIYETAVQATTLYPGVAEALRSLRAAGARLGLCTNKPIRPTRAVLAHFGIADLFEAVVGGDSLPVRKPDPAPLLHVAGALGGGPVLYVGDSEVDAEAAQRADMPFLLFTEGYRKTPVADLPHSESFARFDALPEIAARLFASA